MATFSAGWHSYAFKSMLRSRFSISNVPIKNKEESDKDEETKEPKEPKEVKEIKVSRPPASVVPPNASFHEGVATKDVSIDNDTGLTARIFLPACCIKPGRINEFGWMMKRLGEQDWLPPLLSPDKKSTHVSASVSASSSQTPPISASSSTSSPGTASTSSASTSTTAGMQPIALDSARAAGAASEQSAAGSSTESSNEQFWQGVNGHSAEAPAEAAAEGPEAAGAAPAAPVNAGREYTGYIPRRDHPNNHRLPVIVQFHGGGFVTGNKDSPCNDIFCRRLARVCNSIVIAVGYRLAPEHKCPAAYDDGYEVLKWLSRQTILGEVEHDMQQSQQQQQPSQQLPGQGKSDAAQDSTGNGLLPTSSGGSAGGREGLDEAGAEGGKMRDDEGTLGTGTGLGLLQEVADPWIAVHADVSRCLVLGVSSGGNIADQVTRRACGPQGVNDLNPLVLAGQILLYPLFGGSMRTPSESKAKDAYFYDVPTAELVFKNFLGTEDFSMDHPAVNPMLREQLPPGMSPTLLVVADHDILTDRIIAYSVFLKNFGVDVQVNSYKDVVHGFASYISMVNTPQAEACVEDIAMWVAKHVSSKHQYSELSY